jgi:microcystin-dependent protein
MKKILFLIVLVFTTFFTHAQTNIPDLIHLTAVARDANNQPITNQNIYVKIQVFNGNTTTGTLVYCEQAPASTNQFGEFSLDFGGAASLYCMTPPVQMISLDWSSPAKSIKVSFQPNGNASGTFVDIYSGAFATVPYSFASRSAERLVTPGATSGQVLGWNGSAWVPVTPATGSTLPSGSSSGQLLTWNGSSWVPQAPASQLPAGASTGQVITWNGSAWIPQNTANPLPGGSASGQILTWNGSSWVAQSPAGQIPAGTIMPYAGNGVPSGWMLCDGAVVNSANYPALYSAIGTSWGIGGGGAGNFNLPDLRGMFLRGKDFTAGKDPDAGSRTASNAGGSTGNNVGSVQADAFQGHRHKVYRSDLATGGSWQMGLQSANFQIPNAGLSNSSDIGGVQAATPTDDGVNGIPKISSESRPRNAYVLYIIKI